MASAVVRVLLTVFAIVVVAFGLRIRAVLPGRRRQDHLRRRQSVRDGQVAPYSATTTSASTKSGPKCLLVVLGSGGHTAEMLSMLSRAAKQSSPSRSNSAVGVASDKTDWWSGFSRRIWVVGAGDGVSAARAHEFEQEQRQRQRQSERTLAADDDVDAYTVSTVPRARRIHQPLATTPLSALACLFACIRTLLAQPRSPDVVLANGPATAAVMVLAVLLVRVVDVRARHTRVVYVESWARVRSLSLSGRVLCRLGLVDRFLVQWPELHGAGGGVAEYLGGLIE